MFPRNLLCFAILPAILCLAVNRANAQANVTENQSTYIYVDANRGSDGNSGAANSPFQSIQAAINRANYFNQQGIGVKVIVNAGVYREAVNISGYSTTGATLTVQAANVGTAVISGSDVVTGWNDQGSGVFAAPWYGNPGGCAIPSGWPYNLAPITLRTEMVFVNGNPLTQVMSYRDLQQGTFFMDDSAGTLYVSPAAGVNIWSATVEVATRPQTLSVSNRSNVVLRGLVFRHAASCINANSANIYGSYNVLIDSVQAMWNNWAGIGVYSSSNLTIQNSVSSYNGGLGFMASRIQNALYNSNESDYNNWRGAAGGLFDWGMGGTKLMFTRNTMVQNHYSYRNLAQGLWFDTDNENGTVNNVMLSGNVMSGLQVEANEGPINISNSVICANGAGVNLLNSQNVSINSNILFNNGGSGIYDAGEIFVAGFAGGHPISNWLTGEYYNLFTVNTVMLGNTIVNGWPGEKLFGTYLNGYDWSQFSNSLSSSGNAWYDPATSQSYMLPNGKVVNLTAWQSAVGTDYSSWWGPPPASPAGVCTVPNPVYNDFGVSLNRGSYTMAGAKAVASVRVASYGDGPVTLSLEGLPSGVSAYFSANHTARGQITLTFSASAYAGWQTVPVTLWAKTGDRVHSITFNLTVAPY